MLYRKSLLLALAALAIGLPAACKGGSNSDHSKYQSYDGFTIAENPVLPPREIHPSLWFKQTENERLREKRDADDFSRGLWRQISQDVLLTMPLPGAPQTGDAPRIQHYYATMSKLAKVNALMSLI